jgi:signal transduction histidine kinase
LYNDEWISLGNQHKLKLERLASGSYQLELKGVNGRGVASGNIIHYNLFIKKPYYQSAWFYTLIFFACVGIIYLIFLNRYMNLKSLEHQRVQIASDLHDEIGGLITRITIYASSVKEGYLSTEETKSRLDKITSISRSLSGAVRDVLWSIDARNDMTSNLSDYMNEHVQSQIRYTDIQLTFEVKDADRNAKITAYARQQLYRIFKESINNIMKHSKPTYIKVYYSHNTKGFTLTIENDGVEKAEPMQKKSSGQGTKNIQMRARRINAIAETERRGDLYFVRVQSQPQSFWSKFLHI